MEQKLRISKPIQRDLYDAATFIWRTGQKVTKENLSAIVKAHHIKVDKASIEDMVKLSDFLDMICP
jgi:ribosomal protein L12E/L44/L45/RPP1/RPP2